LDLEVVEHTSNLDFVEMVMKVVGLDFEFERVEQAEESIVVEK